MTVKEIGIILHGATGRIGATQHLANALAPIRAEGGLVSGANRIMPRLLLAGRNATRLEEIARLHGGVEWTTDVDAALAKPAYSIFFDAAATEQRVAALTKAIAAGKHIYSEKPAAPTVVEGLALLHAARARGLKTGVVEDKIYLPGLQKLRTLSADGFFGRVTGFRLEFGWWVFDGIERASQRPSWNYKRATGGGLTLDMYPHWRYVLEGILGPIRRVVTAASTAIPERRDETGAPYRVDVEDASLTLAELANGVIGSIICSWATRVRRDDLLTLQIDGTAGSAIAGLHRCWSCQTFQSGPRSRHRLSRRLEGSCRQGQLHQFLPHGVGEFPAPRCRRRAADKRLRGGSSRRAVGTGLLSQPGRAQMGFARRNHRLNAGQSSI